jgi:hypothetical protein
MCFGRIRIMALFLAASSVAAGMSAASPAQAYQHNQSDLEFMRIAAKPGTATKPGSGKVSASRQHSMARTMGNKELTPIEIEVALSGGRSATSAKPDGGKVSIPAHQRGTAGSRTRGQSGRSR